VAAIAGIFSLQKCLELLSKGGEEKGRRKRDHFCVYVCLCVLPPS
jgi:hypothetical protein